MHPYPLMTIHDRTPARPPEREVWFAPLAAIHPSTLRYDPLTVSLALCELSIHKAVRVLACMHDTSIRSEGPGIVWFVHAAGARECVRRLRYEGVSAEYIGEHTSAAARAARLARHEAGAVEWLVLTHGAHVSPIRSRAEFVIFAELPLARAEAGRAMQVARRTATAAREVFMVFRHWSDAHVLELLGRRAPAW